MPRGGRLTIETENIRVDGPLAMIHRDMPPGDYVLLAVSDTGSGMDLDTQKRIFEPFFTTKPQGQGTGLGLATVYGIVKQSEGFIWVYSEPDRGSNFKIYLPRAQEVSEAEAENIHPHTPRGTETILVVEDEEGVRELTSEFLSISGYRVLVARNGAEALQVCRDFDGPIHVMVTDVVMPGLSGRDLAEQAARIRPSMRILFVSGYSDDAIAHQGVIEPNSSFLEKPFTHSALTARIREILDEPGVVRSSV
ncbi:MAG: response regulator [Acidobacteria bacterium]|nr:response regulator [Acidobacteriota bacterium]